MIRVSSSDVYKLMFNLTIVNKTYVTVTLGWHDSTFLQTALHSKSTNNTFLQTTGTTTGLNTTLHTKSTRKTFYKPQALLLSLPLYNIPKTLTRHKNTTTTRFLSTALQTRSTHKTFKKTLALLHSVLLRYEPPPISRLFTNNCHGYCLITALHTKYTQMTFCKLLLTLLLHYVPHSHTHTTFNKSLVLVHS